jgi:hypothetical protein
MTDTTAPPPALLKHPRRQAGDGARIETKKTRVKRPSVTDAVEDFALPPGVQAAVRAYRDRGIGVARLRKGKKWPKGNEWTKRSAEPGDFQPGDNVGLLCGWLSDGGVSGRHLVCVDLDSKEAIEKARGILPPTRAIEGRKGKPQSHW